MTTIGNAASMEVDRAERSSNRRRFGRTRRAVRSVARLPANLGRRVFSTRTHALFVILSLLIGAGLIGGKTWLQRELPPAPAALQIVGGPASALRALIESPHFVLTDEHMQRTWIIEANQLRLVPLPEGGNIAGPAFALDGAPLGQATVVVALHPGSPLRDEWAAATSRRVIAVSPGDPFLEITAAGGADPRLYRLAPG